MRRGGVAGRKRSRRPRGLIQAAKSGSLVGRILDWYRDGADVEAKMLPLSDAGGSEPESESEVTGLAEPGTDAACTSALRQSSSSGSSGAASAQAARAAPAASAAE